MRINTILALFVVSAFLFVMFLCGCTTTKDVSKQSASVTTDIVKEKDDSIRLLLSVVARYEQEKSESQYNGVKFQDKCDTAALRRILTTGLVPSSVIDEYLKRLSECKDEVEFTAEGAFKAKGNLSAAYKQSEKYERQISTLQTKYDSLAKSKQKEITHVVLKTVTVEKHKKKQFLGQWWVMLIIGFVAGSFAGWKFRGFIKQFDGLRNA